MQPHPTPPLRDDLGHDQVDGSESHDEPVRIQMDKRVDLAIALAVAAVGVMIVLLATQFRTGRFPDPVTARGLPYFTGSFMAVAGLFLAARRIATWSVLPGHLVMSEGKEDDPAHPSSAARSFAIAGLALAWAALLRPAGFLLVTPPILFAMLWLMRVRSGMALAGFALGGTLLVWTVFSHLLRITLPLGPLTSIARAWGLTP